MIGEEAQLLQVRGGDDRRGGLVREDAQRLQLLARREQPVVRLVGPEEPDHVARRRRAAARAASAGPTRAGRARCAASVQDRRRARCARSRLVVRQQEAAFDLELRVEQRLDVVEEDAPASATLSSSQPTAARGSSRAGLRVDRAATSDVLEAERVADADADARRISSALGSRSDRDETVEQLLEREPVARGLGRLLRRLHRERRVVGERDEDVELLVGRAQAAHRLVDGEDAEQVAVGWRIGTKSAS